MRYKTIIALLLFACIFILVWVFHAVVGFVFNDIVISPYAVVGGLTETFGPDLAWWATLALVLACLVVAEVAVTTIRQRLSGRVSQKTEDGAHGQLAKMGTQVWKELEKDPHFKRQLQDMYDNGV